MTVKKFNLRIFTTLFVIAVLFFSLAPGQIQAQTGGLVPCGYDLNNDGKFDPKTEGCQICHFFVLFDNIVKFVLQKIVPPIAALMLVFGGVMFFAAAGDPAKLGTAKSLFTAVAIGLVIIYGAYLLVNLFFTAIGVSQWTGLTDNPATPEIEGWFKYPCP